MRARLVPWRSASRAVRWRGAMPNNANAEDSRPSGGWQTVYSAHEHRGAFTLFFPNTFSASLVAPLVSASYTCSSCGRARWYAEPGAGGGGYGGALSKLSAPASNCMTLPSWPAPPPPVSSASGSGASAPATQCPAPSTPLKEAIVRAKVACVAARFKNGWHRSCSDRIREVGSM